MLPPVFLAKLKSLLPPDGLLTDPVDCYAYAYDNSRKIFPPEAVAFATDEKQVQQIVWLCVEHDVPLIARGRGTGTAGGACRSAADWRCRWNACAALSKWIRRTASSCASRACSTRKCRKPPSRMDFSGRPIPPAPLIAPLAAISPPGAAGPHAVKYGTTRENVLGLSAVTGSGEDIRTGCYTTKGVVGYDLTRLMIGSEGTLAIITEATLKLTPLPQATTPHAGALPRHRAVAAAAITAIMAQPEIPSALEFIDNASLDLIRGRHPGMLPSDTRALLMIEVDGSPHEIEDSAKSILAACNERMA